jgi:hypothetical protein
MLMFLCAYAMPEKEVERKDCKQDNDNDGYGSPLLLAFSAIFSLLGLTPKSASV